MKLIHIADTHLGRASFNKTTEDGSNLRETLIYQNFQDAIQKIINEKPDVLVHAGDLFDTVKPKTKAYTTALECLDWLQEAGIPLVMIAGNHDMPKTAHTVCPLEVIARSNMVHAAFSFRYQRVEIGDTMFHLVPNMLHAEDYRTAIAEVQPSGVHNNVLVTHGLASTIRDKRLSTVAEFELTPDILLESFDYIALGHYHGMMQVGPRAWYSGSIEHLTYGEIKDMKGSLLVDPGRQEVQPFPLVSTLMEDLGTIIMDGRSMDDVTDEIQFRAREYLGFDAMLQITLDYGTEPVRALPSGALEELREDLLDLKIRVRSQETEKPVMQQQDLHAIDYLGEFPNFLQQRPMDALKRMAVERCGVETLKTVMAEHQEETI